MSPEKSHKPETGSEAELSPSVIREGLGTAIIGKKIHFHPELESTNVSASLLARKGGGEGTVFLAESQTRGKGRKGRTWISPGGWNLYLSVILMPKENLDRLGLWTLGAGLAVSTAIEKTTGLAPLLKWPNDLRVKGRKVGGILMESVLQGSRVKSLILGLGLNVNMPQEEFPPGIRENSASLSFFLKKTVDRNTLCRTILGEIERMRIRFNGGELDSILEEYEACSETINRRVRVRRSGKDVTGLAVGFSDKGELRLRTDSGRVETVRSEDIDYLRSLDASGN